MTSWTRQQKKTTPAGLEPARNHPEVFETTAIANYAMASHVFLCYSYHTIKEKREPADDLLDATAKKDDASRTRTCAETSRGFRNHRNSQLCDGVACFLTTWRVCFYIKAGGTFHTVVLVCTPVVCFPPYGSRSKG
jgi:hypothetical protein